MVGAHELNVDPHEFDSKRVLVTGGTKGIGQAVAARLRKAGATVLITARTRPSDVADTDLFVATDITTAEGCAAVADAVRKRLGGIDIVVHVVGGSSAPAGGFAVLDDGEWHRALDLSLFPAVRLDRALLPAMIEQGSGVIIHCISPRSRASCRCPKRPSLMLRPKRRSQTTARVCPRRSARKAFVWSGFLPAGLRQKPPWVWSTNWRPTRAQTMRAHARL